MTTCPRCGSPMVKICQSCAAEDRLKVPTEDKMIGLKLSLSAGRIQGGAYCPSDEEEKAFRRREREQLTEEYDEP